MLPLFIPSRVPHFSRSLREVGTCARVPHPSAPFALEPALSEAEGVGISAAYIETAFDHGAALLKHFAFPIPLPLVYVE
jgi:hypothetical protein